MYNKLIDEYVHNSCTILTFATAFRPAFLKMTREAWQAEINKTPLKRRAEYKRSVIEHGLDSEFVADALAHHEKLLSGMADSLKGGPYLAGNDFSNADCAVIPYILRLELLKLSGMWDRYPVVAEWWGRMRARPSVKATIFGCQRLTGRRSKTSRLIRGRRSRHCGRQHDGSSSSLRYRLVGDQGCP